jgi:hypothetical protein
VLANFCPLLFHHAYSSCMVYETIDQSLKFDLALIKSEEVMHVDNRAVYTLARPDDATCFNSHEVLFSEVRLVVRLLL